MRRVLFVAVFITATLLAGAAPALAGHCINQSKPEGAGNHTTIIVNVQTGEATALGKNGGFADVYLDFNGDGVGDLQVENDTFIIGNHNNKVQKNQVGNDGVEVLPGAVHNGSPDHGVGFPSDD